MIVPTFLEFQNSEKAKKHVGLRPVVHAAVKDFCDNQSDKFSRIRNPNQRYYAFFCAVEDATARAGLTDRDPDDPKGRDYYSTLVKNWGKFSKRDGYVSLGNFDKALLVFYYFLYYHRTANDDGKEAKDNTIGFWIERQLDFNSDIRDTRRQADQALRDKKRLASYAPGITQEQLDRESPSRQGAMSLINYSNARLSFYWVNYDGIEKHYFYLGARRKTEQRTYMGHSWVVRLSETNIKVHSFTINQPISSIEVTQDMIDKVSG